MNILVVLIIVSLLIASGFLVAFVWAVRSGQFDDAATPSYRMLWDNTTPENKKSKSNKQSTNHKHKSHGN